MNAPARFDLALVYSSFRRHERYLNIAKALGRTRRIGLVDLGWEAKKLGTTEEAFRKALADQGVVPIDGPAVATAMIVPRLGPAHIDQLASWVDAHLDFGRALHLPSNPSLGVLGAQQLHQRFGPLTVLAYDLAHFAEYEPQTRLELNLVPHEIVEIGSPCAAHPVFPDFAADYVYAYPSHLAVPTKRHAYALVRDMWRALDALPRDQVVAFKPHNASDQGNNLSQYGRRPFLPAPTWMARWILKGTYRLLSIRRGRGTVADRIPEGILGKVTAVAHELAARRCVNVLERYPGFGLEHFIAGVRKGVITGLSNLVWEALYQRKPVFNADHMPPGDRPFNYPIMVERYAMHEWHGFSTRGFSTIGDSARRADLIGYLERLIAAPVPEGSGVSGSLTGLATGVD